MSVSSLTAMTIQSWPDTESIEKDGIYVTAAKDNNRWAGFVYLVKGGALHSLLLDTKPGFDSEKSAVGYLNEIIAQIRELQSDNPPKNPEKITTESKSIEDGVRHTPVSYDAETTQIQRAELLRAVKEEIRSANDAESDTQIILNGAGIKLLRAVLRDLDKAELALDRAQGKMSFGEYCEHLIKDGYGDREEIRLFMLDYAKKYKTSAKRTSLEWTNYWNPFITTLHNVTRM